MKTKAIAEPMHGDRMFRVCSFGRHVETWDCSFVKCVFVGGMKRESSCSKNSGTTENDGNYCDCSLYQQKLGMHKPNRIFPVSVSVARNGYCLYLEKIISYVLRMQTDVE